MKRLLPAVELEWVDSSSWNHEGPWTDAPDYEDKAPTARLTMHSIAYVIVETEDRLVLAAHLSLNDHEDSPVGQVGGTLIIPKCCIVSRRDFSCK